MGAFEFLLAFTFLVAGILATVGYAVITVTPADFKFARASFLIAGVLVFASGIMWGVLTNSPILTRVLVVGLIGAVSAVATNEAIRWVDNREKIAGAPTINDAAVVKLSIATSNINKPAYARFPALEGDYIPNINKDNQIFAIDGVFITNSSLIKSITIRFRLLIRADFIESYIYLDNNSGTDLFGRKLLRNYEDNTRLIISPLALQPQVTIGGTLLFIIQFSWGNEFDKKILDKLVTAALNNTLKFTLEIEDVISGEKISIQLPGRYKGE